MTALDYLSDTYCFASDARVLSVLETEKGTALVLDKTIFYPQGGGQPSDIGEIVHTDGRTFIVHSVRLQSDGTVHHYGDFTTETTEMFVSEDIVTLSIDAEKRLLFSKIHTAGHLIDIAVHNASVEGIVPTKGYHYAEGAYVEYDGVLEDTETFLPAIQEALNALLSADIAVMIENLDAASAEEKGIIAPPGKSARLVWFDHYQSHAIGCGGTHVNSTGEVGKVVIRKIQSKKGVTKIKYALSS